MKKFYLDNLKEDSVIKQFNILKSLSSSHFVEAVEHFIQKDNHYLITEYYANNLYDYVPKHLSMKTIKSLKDITTLEVGDKVVFGNLVYKVRQNLATDGYYLYLNDEDTPNEFIFKSFTIFTI